MIRVLASVVALFVFAAPASADHPELLIKRIGALTGELVKAGRTDAEIVDALYVITLGRLPKDKEKEVAVKHLANAKKREAAARDLAWALVNSKEFLALHGLDKDPAEALKVIGKLTKEWEKQDEEKK